MATAERNLISDTARSVRTGEPGSRTHQILPNKIPPARTASPLAPYGEPAPGTATALKPYSETGEPRRGGDELEDARLQLIDLMLLDGADLSRAQIADAIGVSLPTLDSWLAQTRKDRNIPLIAAPAWIKATKSRRLIEWIANECELHVVTSDVVRDAALGRKVREAVNALLERAA